MPLRRLAVNRGLNVVFLVCATKLHATVSSSIYFIPHNAAYQFHQAVPPNSTLQYAQAIPPTPSLQYPQSIFTLQYPQSISSSSYGMYPQYYEERQQFPMYHRQSSSNYSVSMPFQGQQPNHQQQNAAVQAGELNISPEMKVCENLEPEQQSLTSMIGSLKTSSLKYLQRHSLRAFLQASMHISMTVLVLV